MKLEFCHSVPRSDAVVLPCFDPPEWMDGLPDAIRDAAVLAVDSKRFLGAEDSFYTLTFPWEGRLQSVVLAGLGKKEAVLSNRKVFLVMAAALRRCRDLKARTVAVCADNAPGVTDRPDLLRKLGELPYLVNYRFHRYQSGTKEEGFERASVVTRRETDMLSDEASICAESALLARDLTNQPANAMDPAGLGEQVRQIGARCGFSVEVLEPPEIEALGMNCFLAVGRGAQQTPPRLIVMRYAGGGDAPVVGLIGKGILFDSGGYCLKPGAGMKAMFDDMGGAAAVIGAISAAARMKLPINIVSVVAACENKIGPDAFVPGDILQTMAGKSVEMLNTDAEGRLTLADAMTYAIREEGAEVLVDIATLTGAARNAVGNRTAPVLSNEDRLYQLLWQASQASCEKIWRLNADPELRGALTSAVADLKNSEIGAPSGGGCIVAGLFIQEFVEDKPWLHIDMAPVNFLQEAQSYCDKGATGYGVSLLYHLMKAMPDYFSSAKEERI